MQDLKEEGDSLAENPAAISQSEKESSEENTIPYKEILVQRSQRTKKSVVDENPNDIRIIKEKSREGSVGLVLN